MELAYISGERRPFSVSRAAIERHMAHVTDPDALRLVFGMSATASLAARLRHLESQATTVLDAAMTPAPDKDGNLRMNAALALKAIREVRATIELTGRVAGTLIDRVERTDSRPDIDQGIEAALRAKGQVSAPAAPTQHFDHGQEATPALLALPAAPQHREGG